MACLRWYEDNPRLQKMGKNQSIYLVFGMLLLIVLPHLVDWMKTLNGLPTSEAKVSTTILLVILLILGWFLALPIGKRYFAKQVKR